MASDASMAAAVSVEYSRHFRKTERVARGLHKSLIRANFERSYVLNTPRPANPYSPQPNPATLSPARWLSPVIPTPSYKPRRSRHPGARRPTVNFFQSQERPKSPKPTRQDSPRHKAVFVCRWWRASPHLTSLHHLYPTMNISAFGTHAQAGAAMQPLVPLSPLPHPTAAPQLAVRVRGRLSSLSAS